MILPGFDSAHIFTCKNPGRIAVFFFQGTVFFLFCEVMDFHILLMKNRWNPVKTRKNKKEKH